MTFTFEPPLPGSWVTGSPSFAVANHEAGHGILAAYSGFPVDELRIDRPEVDSIGWCRFRHPDGDDPDVLRARLRVALAGPLAEPRPIDWRSYHERHAMELAVRLGWGRDELDAEIDGLRLLLQVLSPRLKEIADMLLERGAIPGDELLAAEGATR